MDTDSHTELGWLWMSVFCSVYSGRVREHIKLPEFKTVCEAKDPAGMELQYQPASLFMPGRPVRQPYSYWVPSPSNGNASETKANESFDNGVFLDIEAKRTPSIVRKLFSKRSEHIR